MTSVARFSTDGRLYQAAFVLLLVGGWMILAKPQNLMTFPAIRTSAEKAPAQSTPATAASKPARKTRASRAKATIIATNADLPTMIAAANETIGIETLTLETSGDGTRILTVQALNLLLTDKNRPRISRAASSAAQPVLTQFVNQMSGKKSIVIEASADIPDSYVRPLKRYLESYKGWRISRVAPETAGQFRVRLQEAQ